MSASGVKIPKKSRGLMLRLGLAQGETPDVFAEGEHRGMFEALRRLAGREGTGPRTLWLCLFDPGHSYAEDVFAPLLGDGMAPLLAFLKENGYERGGDLRDGKLSLDYAKEYGKKPSPLKDAWAERTHGGISAMHYDYVAEAACLALRVPMLRELLERQEAMTPRVRAFAIRTFKRCDGCGYCTQTDKGGGRPRAFVKVSSGEDKALVCTLFPGFYACRTNVDEALAHDIQEFLLFVDCNFR